MRESARHDSETILKKARSQSRKLERELEAVRDQIAAEVAELEALKEQSSVRLRSALLMILGTPEPATVYKHEARPDEAGRMKPPTPIRPGASETGRELSAG